ncbi:hypothetical protein RZS08_53775, partial [Arthrospira platensis SPKY1]|nr:hypothetical protein [Arthrospira platensis SPKY1]
KEAILINGTESDPFVYTMAGDVLTYRFTVTNTGNVTLSNVRIDDPLTGSFDLLVSPSTLLPGQTGLVTSTYIVQQTDIDSGEVLNVATAKGTFNSVDYTDEDDETV